MKNFNVEQETKKLITYLKDWFNQFGTNSKAVIGISGGKDSTVAAALLVRALGNERVVGVLMPNGHQADLNDSFDVCKLLGIDYKIININDTYESMIYALKNAHVPITDQLRINLAPRIRMTTLYAVAQGLDTSAFVINTCNRSEDYVGYSTKYGDAAGDIAVLQDYLVSEVLQIGDYLELPKELVHKTPSDGLCGKTDEDNLGFTYADLDAYILWREDLVSENEDCPIRSELTERINNKHFSNLHKLEPIPSLYKAPLY